MAFFRFLLLLESGCRRTPISDKVLYLADHIVGGADVWKDDTRRPRFKIRLDLLDDFFSRSSGYHRQSLEQPVGYQSSRRVKPAGFPRGTHRFDFRPESHATQQVAIVISQRIIGQRVTQRFASGAVAVGDGATYLTDD